MLSNAKIQGGPLLRRPPSRTTYIDDRTAARPRSQLSQTSAQLVRREPPARRSFLPKIDRAPRRCAPGTARDTGASPLECQEP